MVGFFFTRRHSLDTPDLMQKEACNQGKKVLYFYSGVVTRRHSFGKVYSLHNFELLFGEQLPLSFAQWLSAPFGVQGSNPYKAHIVPYVYPCKKLPLLQSLSGDVPVAPKQRQELKII